MSEPIDLLDARNVCGQLEERAHAGLEVDQRWLGATLRAVQAHPAYTDGHHVQHSDFVDLALDLTAVQAHVRAAATEVEA